VELVTTSQLVVAQPASEVITYTCHKFLWSETPEFEPECSSKETSVYTGITWKIHGCGTVRFHTTYIYIYIYIYMYMSMPITVAARCKA
jgi:hypothetical protein